jgi:hypothetical protein
MNKERRPKNLQRCPRIRDREEEVLRQFIRSSLISSKIQSPLSDFDIPKLPIPNADMIQMPIYANFPCKCRFSSVARNAYISRYSLQKREKISMYNVQRPIGVPLPDNTRNINLTRTLRDHLDVNLFPHH